MPNVEPLIIPPIPHARTNGPVSERQASRSEMGNLYEAQLSDRGGKDRGYLPPLPSKRRIDDREASFNKKPVFFPNRKNRTSAVLLGGSEGPTDDDGPSASFNKKTGTPGSGKGQAVIQLIKKAKAACKLPSDQRSKAQTAVIGELVEKHIRLFADLEPELRNQLTTKLALQELEKHSVCFYQGAEVDEHSKVYVILDGKVGVYLLPPEDIRGGKAMASRNELGELVCTLERGACFGELALLHGKPRGATVKVCSQSCAVVSLEKKHFLTHLYQPFQQVIEERAGYLKALPLFQGVPMADIMPLAFYMKPVTVDAGTVFRHADHLIHFITAGEAKLMASSGEKRGPHKDDEYLMGLTYGMVFGEDNLYSQFEVRDTYIIVSTKLEALRMHAIDFELYAPVRLLQQMQSDIEFRISYLQGKRMGINKNMQVLLHKRPSLVSYMPTTAPSGGLAKSKGKSDPLSAAPRSVHGALGGASKKSKHSKKASTWEDKRASNFSHLVAGVDVKSSPSPFLRMKADDGKFPQKPSNYNSQDPAPRVRKMSANLKGDNATAAIREKVDQAALRQKSRNPKTGHY